MKWVVLFILMLSIGCTSPKDGDDRRISLRGYFVSSNLSASKAGISLSGQLLWHANIEGEREGIVLRGILQTQP